MSQLALQWSLPEQYAAQDFIVSDANHTAFTFIEHWPNHNNQPIALLVGAEASGKTHLAHCWAARTQAQFLDNTRLGSLSSEALWGSSHNVILENIEKVDNEAAFFHLLRHAELAHGHLLLTCAKPVRDLAFITPDIQSRLLALPVAFIGQPDEALLQAFYAKSFADRQWRINTDITQYLTTRCERSFAAANAILKKLDYFMATTKKEITLHNIKPMIEFSL